MSEDYLAKIVDELVQNAFKFSDPGKRVSVTLSGSPNGVVLSVTDQGRGFSTEHITKVGAYMQFDRKIQEQQGLGLGLVIARRLTELHGGTLSIQSERGTITTVAVKLPKVAGELRRAGRAEGYCGQRLTLFSASLPRIRLGNQCSRKRISMTPTSGAKSNRAMRSGSQRSGASRLRAVAPTKSHSGLLPRYT